MNIVPSLKAFKDCDRNVGCVFQFDEGRNDLDAEGADTEAIRAHITANQLPTVIEFTQEVKLTTTLHNLQFNIIILVKVMGFMLQSSIESDFCANEVIKIVGNLILV